MFRTEEININGKLLLFFFKRGGENNGNNKQKQRRACWKGSKRMQNFYDFVWVCLRMG